MEAMHIGIALNRILHQVIVTDLCLGPVHISKVYLDNAYMRLWEMIEDVLSVTLIIPNKTPRY